METLTLNEWIDQFKAQFNDRELNYMRTLKAKIVLQLKDKETAQVHLHDLEYLSKEAEIPGN